MIVIDFFNTASVEFSDLSQFVSCFSEADFAVKFNVFNETVIFSDSGIV